MYFATEELPFRVGNLEWQGRFVTRTVVCAHRTPLDNLFHLFTQSPDGAHNFALYGQHSGDHQISSFGETHIASHFVAQTRNERVWTADYYRGNNSALGIVVGFMPEPEGPRRGQCGVGAHAC